MMCLSPTKHELWKRGAFILKPVGTNVDKTSIEVEFIWQARRSLTMDYLLPVTTMPSTSRGLSSPDVRSTLTVTIDGAPVHLRTGHRIFITTPDAEKLPLPDMDLLDMQFALSRIVNLSGAGKVAELDDQTLSEEGDGMSLAKEKEIEDWVASCEQSSDDDS